MEVSYDAYILSRGIITERYLFDGAGFTGSRNVDQS
jgi:hypothetical protein